MLPEIAGPASSGDDLPLRQAEMPRDRLQRSAAANAFGPGAIIKAVLPVMAGRRRGRAVNSTSVGGFITVPDIACYCDGKFALGGISELSGEARKAFCILVAAGKPGQMPTD